MRRPAAGRRIVLPAVAGVILMSAILAAPAPGGAQTPPVATPPPGAPASPAAAPAPLVPAAEPPAAPPAAADASAPAASPPEPPPAVAQPASPAAAPGQIEAGFKSAPAVPPPPGAEPPPLGSEPPVPPPLATTPPTVPSATAAPAPHEPPALAPPAPEATPPAGGGVAERPAPPAPVAVQHPRIISTDRVNADGQSLPLYGVIGHDGGVARLVETSVAQAGDTLACTAHGTDGYECKMGNGTDLALFALVNGAAQARDDAPDLYKLQEDAARTARRGVWAGLPPPPVEVKHPGVYDTATLIGGTVTYPLDGIEGTGGELASQFAGYLQQAGDSVQCQSQGATGAFVCLLPDGTDVATVALVNGAARVSQDAPDNYRLQQADAIKNRRGIWQIATDEEIQTVTQEDAVIVLTATDYAVALGPTPDELAAAADGVTYFGDQPAVIVDGAPAFMVYGGPVGWGYYDHFHHWRGAPPGFAHHMERFHPGGHGLRAYASLAALHNAATERSRLSGRAPEPIAARVGAAGAGRPAPGAHSGIPGLAPHGAPGFSQHEAKGLPQREAPAPQHPTAALGQHPTPAPGLHQAPAPGQHQALAKPAPQPIGSSFGRPAAPALPRGVPARPGFPGAMPAAHAAPATGAMRAPAPHAAAARPAPAKSCSKKC